MAALSWNYDNERAAKARLGVHLSGNTGAFIVASGWLLLLGGIAALVSGWAVGWLLIGLAGPAYMLHRWYNGELRHLPNGQPGTVEGLVSSDSLGRLPRNPAPADIAMIAGQVEGGHFMGARLGLTANTLSQLATAVPSDMTSFWAAAERARVDAGVERISGSVLATALVEQFPDYERLLAQIHLDRDDLIEGIKWQQHLRDLAFEFRRPRRTGGIARDWSFGYSNLLARYARIIGQNGPGLTVDVASHVDAIDHLVETFGNDGRQNAVLVGQEGVGKTTIIEAFATRLMDADAKLPASLKFRQVFMLDSSALIAAAPGRGELEHLIMQILSEAYRAKNIILCLDNAQLFFEEGVGSVDLSNVLQPILEAGRVRMILSMNEQRYLQIGQRNPGLINAMNRVSIAPANYEETMHVMQEQLLMVEAQRKVVYTYQSLKEAYRLSERYLHELAMPGRAMRLLEQAAAHSENGLVTINSVQQAIEKTMDVKVSVASESDDRERLLNLEQHIHERMINQSRAVEVVSDALRRARAGVRNQNRPIGTFLFLGPTGVGKTELSKALAEVYFGGEGRIIRLDLNEFVRAEDVTRLIADGADDPGSLTAQVMKQPFSVVLLDEIEKAAPEVLATLLQLLDEGILRDINNREISFRDAIIVATSNAGADRIREYIERGYNVAQFESQFTNELINSGQFRPEFLNRFDEIVVFTPLSKSDLLKVVNLIIAGVNKTLESQKVTVVVDEGARQVLVDRGYDPRLGARPMRRVVQKAVENTVAKAMLSGELTAGGTITITQAQVEQILGASEQVAQMMAPTDQASL